MRPTPSIKRYKDLIQRFEAFIKPHFGTRYTLVRAEPKSNPMAWASNAPSMSKGVDSDLILIFEDRTKSVGSVQVDRFTERSVYDSVAFSFNWKDEESDDLSVAFSIKQDGVITSSTPFDTEIFRELLRQINRTFANEGVPKDQQTLLWRMQAVFMENSEHHIEIFDETRAVKNLLGKDANKPEKLIKELQSARDNLSEAEAQISRIVHLVDQESKTSPEAMEIQRLEKKLKLLRSQLKRNKEKSEKEKGIDQWKIKAEQFRDLESKTSEKLRKLGNKLLSLASGHPNSRKAIKEWVQDNINRALNSR